MDCQSTGCLWLSFTRDSHTERSRLSRINMVTTKRPSLGAAKSLKAKFIKKLKSSLSDDAFKDTTEATDDPKFHQAHDEGPANCPDEECIDRIDDEPDKNTNEEHNSYEGFDEELDEELDEKPTTCQMTESILIKNGGVWWGRYKSEHILQRLRSEVVTGDQVAIDDLVTWWDSLQHWKDTSSALCKNSGRNS